MKFIEGKIYFICTYVHPKFPIPKVEPWVFLGKFSSYQGIEFEKELYIFEDPQKYYEADLKQDIEPHESFEGIESNYISVGEECMDMFSDIEGAINWLTSAKKQPKSNTIL